MLWRKKPNSICFSFTARVHNTYFSGSMSVYATMWLAQGELIFIRRVHNNSIQSASLTDSCDLKFIFGTLWWVLLSCIRTIAFFRKYWRRQEIIILTSIFRIRSLTKKLVRMKHNVWWQSQSRIHFCENNSILNRFN